MVTHHLTRANFSEGSKSFTNEVNVFRSTSHITKLRFPSGISKTPRGHRPEYSSREF